METTATKIQSASPGASATDDTSTSGNPTRRCHRITHLFRRTGAKMAMVAAAMAVGAMAIVVGGSNIASASTVSNTTYGGATECYSISNSSYGASWQQQLEEAVPTTTSAFINFPLPIAVTDYAGTAKLVWYGQVAYLASNGVWTLTGQTVEATATSAIRVGNQLEYIGWSQTSNYVLGVQPGNRYAIYGTTGWVNSQNQWISVQGGYLPNGNCS